MKIILHDHFIIHNHCNGLYKVLDYFGLVSVSFYIPSHNKDADDNNNRKVALHTV